MSDEMMTCPRCEGHGLVWCTTCFGKGEKFLMNAQAVGAPEAIRAPVAMAGER